MTNPFFAIFDADAHADFLDAGMADIGSYSVGAGDPVDRRVFVNSGVQSLGEYNQVLAPRTVVGFLLADGAVVKGAKVVIAARTYTLQEIDLTDQHDGSLQWWAVRNG